jgi:hypothetical protein
MDITGASTGGGLAVGFGGGASLVAISGSLLLMGSGVSVRARGMGALVDVDAVLSFCVAGAGAELVNFANLFARTCVT